MSNDYTILSIRTGNQIFNSNEIFIIYNNAISAVKKCPTIAVTGKVALTPAKKKRVFVLIIDSAFIRNNTLIGIATELYGDCHGCKLRGNPYLLKKAITALRALITSLALHTPCSDPLSAHVVSRESCLISSRVGRACVISKQGRQMYSFCSGVALQ